MVTIAAKNVRSLCFDGDRLIDWAGGARVFTLDGVDHGARLNLTYHFDATVASPDGRFTVVYERLGTKALLMERNGKLLRELNRSYYCAEAYEYPVDLFRLPDGRDVLAHCPDAYNRVEIDEVLTGRWLTASDGRKPDDFFHSRLASSPSGTRLLSAGWVWHPFDAVLYFDVTTALSDPADFDATSSHSPQARWVGFAEESSACWLSDDRVAVGSSDEPEDSDSQDEMPEEVRLRPSGIAVYDVPMGRYVRTFKLREPPGTMMRVGEDHVMSFYRHPKLISLITGEIVRAWTELETGTQTSSICRGIHASLRPLALDPVGRRFAVAGDDAIHVVHVEDGGKQSAG